MSLTSPVVLLVEDDEILAAIIEENLVSRSFQIEVVSNAEQAWEKLENHHHHFDAILLDRELPGMSGIDLLIRIRSDHRHDAMPVILETVTADAKSIQEGLNAGAYYYLTKPFEPAVLLAVVSSAINQFHGFREAQEDAKAIRRCLAYLERGRFLVHTLDESRSLAIALSSICPNPRKALLGLHELLVNAVEHGNLGLTYDDKMHLILEDRLDAEIRQRQELAENRTKVVEVLFERLDNACVFTIRDQGQGFDWEKYLDFNLDRILDPNGKGIAMARKTSFDSLEFQGNGSTVVATVHLQGEPG